MRCNMTYLQKEIEEQPQIIERTIKTNKSQLDELAKKIKDSGYLNIMFSARGSSRNACNYFKYLLEILGKISVNYITPSVITLYDGNVDFSKSVFIAVSQSGMGEDVIQVTKKAKKSGALVVTITNDPNSPLSKLGDYNLNLNCGEEVSVPATKTFTAEAVLLAYLAGKLTASDDIINGLDKLPKCVGEIIENQDKIEVLAKKFLNTKEVIILGRGYSAALMDEMVLKMKETTYINSSCYSVPDFYHGPFALAEQSKTFILINNSGKGQKDVEDAKKRLLDIGIKPFVVSDFDSSADFLIAKLPECMSALLYVVFMQLLVLKLSSLKGLNPDMPRGLKKITVTK